jgi:acyl carrier protein
MIDASISIEDLLSGLLANGMRIEGATHDAELIDSGRLDSLGVIELLMLVEQEFGITIEPDDLELENFRTITAIADLVRARAGVPPDRSATQ